MKFKVGDKVKVRSDLEVNKSYGKDAFVEPMLHFLGTEQVINRIIGDKYLLSDDNEYNFTDEMLEQPILVVNSESKDDIVNRPKHYTQGSIEVIDFIEDQKLDFRAANVVKYTCRARYKGKELEDYKKARFYLDRLIKELDSK